MNIVRNIIGTTFALLFATFTFAQVSLGLKTGINYANISTPKITFAAVPSTQALPSFTFGAVAEFGIAKGFAIQTGVDFSKKGFVIAGNIPLKFKDIPLPLGVKATTSLNYVEVPVLAKYNFGNGKVGGYIAAGSTLGYASSARFKTTTNFIIDINVIDKKLNLDALKISRLDIGGTVGVGGTVNFSGVQLFVDARYTHGFKKLDNVPVIDLDFNNRNFALTTGLMIPLTKKYKRPRA